MTDLRTALAEVLASESVCPGIDFLADHGPDLLAALDRAELVGDDIWSWRHAKKCDVERGLSACTCGLSEWRNAVDESYE